MFLSGFLCLAGAGVVFGLPPFFLAVQLDIEESDQELELNTQGEEGEERRRQTSRVSYGILFSLRLLAALSFLLLTFEVVSHSSEIELELQLSNPAQRLWPWLSSLVTVHQDWATFRYGTRLTALSLCPEQSLASLVAWAKAAFRPAMRLQRLYGGNHRHS